MEHNHKNMEHIKHTSHSAGVHDNPQDHSHHSHTHHSHHEHMMEDFRRRFWISLIITIPVLILSPFLQGIFGLKEYLRFSGDIYILFALATAIYFYGGYPFLKGLVDELKKKTPGMMTLIAIAITTAYIYSSFVVFGLKGKVFFWELATLIDIMLLGHWIEMKSVLGASRALDELVKLMPKKAHVVKKDGEIEDIPLADLKKGMVVLIRPGEKIPADGVVIDGKTYVNESLLTGESVPVKKEKGDEVIGGSVNMDGSIKVRVEKTGEESFLAQVVNLVREAQESKSRTQDLANRAAKYLTIIALGAGGLTFFIWKLLMKMDVAFSLERTVTVMVITCPHALGLAVPLVVAVSTALAARFGVLIRDRMAFENARKIDAVIFDKTGTLTEGRFGVTDVISFDEKISNEEILQYAASLELNSEHPIARAIVDKAGSIKVKSSMFRAIHGKGVEGVVDGKKVMVVSPNYLTEKGIKILQKERVNRMMEHGTVVFLIVDDALKGAIALSDKVRSESKEAVRKLKEMGIKCIMITGDNEHVARWVASELGLDEYYAEVLPHQKSQKVQEIQERGLVCGMVGDGVNDAPALAKADVGIAIGAGTQVAIESADIVLVKSNPLDVVSTIKLSRKTYTKMIQNLLWATGYNAITIPLAAGVLYSYGILLSPAVGAVLMSLSTVIVAINARLLKV